MSKDYNNYPIKECQEAADDFVGRGAEVFQKFTCEGCGSRQTMETPNVFYTSGTCEECGATTDIEARGEQAKVGGIIGGTIPLIKNIPKSIYRVTRGEANFGDKVMEAFQNKKVEAMKAFGKDLDDLIAKNPDKTSGGSLVGIMKEVQATAAFDERLNSAINTNEQLRKLGQNPDLARDMPVKEVQLLVTKLNSKIKGKYGPNYIELKDFIHDIKAAQLDAFPEMAPIKENYANIAEPYRLIKSKIKEGSILKNLANKFGDAQLNRRAESLMSKDIKAEVDSYRRTKQVLKTMGIGVGTAGAGLAGGVGYKLFTGN